MVTEYKPLYTVKEVSRVRQVSFNTVNSLMNAGKLPYLLIGTKKDRGSDLERLIENYPAEKAGGE